MAYKNQADQSAYFRQWRNGVGREKFKAAKRRYRARLYRMVADIKSAVGCKNCGETDWRCLDFHHIKGHVKLFNLGESTNGNGSRFGAKKILDEIKKCDVLCANCHRKEHYSLSSAG